MNRPIRWVGAAIAGLAILGASVRPAAAHRLEPINVEYARPFRWGSGVVKITHSRVHFNEVSNELEMEVELGLTDWLQVSVGQPVAWVTEPGEGANVGFGNLETGLRFLVAGGQPGDGYAVSLNPEFAFVSGATGVRDPAQEWGFLVHVDRYTPKWLFFANVGWNQGVRPGEEGVLERGVVYRLAAVRLLDKHWNPTVSILGTHEFPGDRTHLQVAPEIQYFKNSWVEFKVAFPISVTRPTASGGRVGFQVQASFALGRGSD